MDQVVKTVPFLYPEEHLCKAYVLSCMDWRYPEEFDAFIREVLKVETFDHVKLPGAARAIVNCNMEDKGDVVADSMELSVKEHGVSVFIIVNHADCGKEGGRGNFDNIIMEREHHKTLLRCARAKIYYKYPNVQVILIYADLTKDRKFIEFRLVE